ncbi:MAG: iron-containing alcohol dehydrogenase [Thermoprotei archaeon]
MEVFQVYNGGVKLFFGPGTIESVKEFLKGYKKLLIVTGKKSARVSGALGDVEKILNELGIEYSVWDRAVPNPTRELVHELAEYYRSGLYEGFIAIGGGSVIDLAKAARVVVVGGGDIKEYLYSMRKAPEKQPFLLAVNLTHGTGTEIDRYAVVTITETKEKLGFNAGYPTVSVDDPRYLITLPRNQTIYTSLDAFAHAVEAATTRLTSPYVRLLAREAIRLIVEYLPKALEKPDNVEYRYWLLYASMIAGIAIDHGVTHYGHAIEHVLTGVKPELAHGSGLGIIHRELIGIIYEQMPENMAYVLEPLEPSLKPIREDASKAVKAYNEFLEKIGFTEKLSDYGFTENDLEKLEPLYNSMIEKRFKGVLPFELPWSKVREMLKKLL